MPSERVQHAYGLIQKTLQQSGVIHNNQSQQAGDASNPYGYSNVPHQQASWQHARPPPPPPVPAYSPNAYGSMPGRPLAGPGPPAPPLVTPTQVTYSSPPVPPSYRPLNSQTQQSWTPATQSNVTTAAPPNPYTPAHGAPPQQQQGFSSIFPPPPPPKPHQYNVQPPPLPPRPGTQGPPPNQTYTWARPQVQTVQSAPNFQNTPPVAHPIYRKYGNVVQSTAGTPSHVFPPPNAAYDQSSTAIQQQPLSWQQPAQFSHQPIQSPAPHHPMWQAPAVQQPQVSPIQQHAQPYATPHTPVNQSSAPPAHVFQSPAPQTPPTIPSVSPPPYNYAYPPLPPGGPPPHTDYFGRTNDSATQCSQMQRPSSIGNNPYNPPVSPPSPTVSPLVSRQGSLASQAGRSNERQDTVSSISTGPVHERHDTVSSISTGVADRPATPKVEASGSGIDFQSGAGVTGGSSAGTSASALGFGGPGGWEYYTPLGGDSEDEAEEFDKGEVKGGIKEKCEPVSPVELPSEPVLTKEETQAQKKGEEDTGEDGIYELPADFAMEATVKPVGTAEDEGKGVMEPDNNETTVSLSRPSTRYNRIPRPQDLIPDLGPWYASSLERYIAMLKQEAYAISDEQRTAAFVEFVAVESQIRGIPYYTQPLDQNQEQTTFSAQKPKLPLDIPSPDTIDTGTEDIQYSPGGRPILRAKASGRRDTDEVKTEVVHDEQQSAYRPFRQGTLPADSETPSQRTTSAATSLPNEKTGKVVQSEQITAPQQPQYKPYTPGTPTVETIRRESFPHGSSISSPTTTPPVGKHEHAETFFPAPLALRAKKDRTSTQLASTSTPVASPPPGGEEEKLSAASALPYPTTPSQTPPPPEPPSAATKPYSTSAALGKAPNQTGVVRLKALLARAPTPSPSSPDIIRIQNTLSAIPSLATTRDHIASLRTAFDKTSPPHSAAAAKAESLFTTLAIERSQTQMLNDMAFESNEITYPELMARDEALKREEVEKVAAEAEKAGVSEGRAYGRWEGEVFAGVYGRVREEVDRGVEGLGVVEDVGATTMGVLSSEEGNGSGDGADAAPASTGLVKINARTGEVIVVDGLAPAGAALTAPAPSSNDSPPQPPSTTKRKGAKSPVDTTLHTIATLNQSTRGLLNLHAYISARHALLADAVAERDACYARAQVAPLEFLVAFDDLENPAAVAAAAIKKPTKDGGEAGQDDGGDDDDDTRKKLRDLRRHFTSARLSAAARAAAEEEARARQTWQRVEAWMGAGVAAVATAIGEITDAVAEVGRKGLTGEGGSDDDDERKSRSEVRELLDRAEEAVKELAATAEELVRAFYEAEVLLNEAEFAVSVKEARLTVFEKKAMVVVGREDDEGWEKETEDVIKKLEAERGKEDEVLKTELAARLKKVGEEQRGKGVQAVRETRAKIVGREEFGDEDRIVGWVT